MIASTEMRRGLPIDVGLCAIVLSAASCAARSTADDEGDSTSGSAGTQESSEASTDGAQSSSSGSDEDATDGASSSGGGGVECPPEHDDITFFSDVQLPEAWVFEGDSGISEGSCEALGSDEEGLTLTCSQLDGGPEQHAVKLRGEGPLVQEYLQPFVGLTELRLSIAYHDSFFPGYVLGSWILRAADGRLLLLAGSSVDAASTEWWSPVEGLALVDRDCAERLNPPDTWPDSWRPLALEVATGFDLVDVYHGQQTTVRTSDGDYVVSVGRAREYQTDSCGDCADVQRDLQFSFVQQIP